MSEKKLNQFNQNWTDTETWVWEMIKTGQIANLNEKFEKSLDPKSDAEWSSEDTKRRLSTDFLEAILTEEFFLSQVKIKGVRIEGAVFKGDINLQHLKLEKQLWLEKCRFEGSVKLMNFHIDDWFSLEDSWVKENLDLNGAQLKSHVSLARIEVLGKVNMVGVKAGSNLELEGGQFHDELNMNSIQIGGSLYLRNKGNFNDVVLQSATIEGVVELDGSTFNSKLDMNLISVKGYLSMFGNASFQNVYLTNAKIGGNLFLKGSTYNDFLDLASVHVDGSLFMEEKTTFKDVYLENAKIMNDLILTGSIFTGKLLMNYLVVEGKLNMDGGAEFNLVNLISAKVGSMFSAIGSTFKDTLNMNSVEVNGSMLMRNKVRAEKIILANARVGGNIELDESEFKGLVNLNSSKIGGSLYLDDHSVFDSVSMVGACVEGVISLSGSYFNNKLNMNSVKTYGSLFMAKGAEFKDEINLISCSIGGNLEFTDSKFYGNILLDNATIGRNFLADRAYFTEGKSFNIRYSKIDSAFYLSGASMGNINLTSTSINSELFLGSGYIEPPVWRKSSKMILWNTKVGALQDAGIKSWPEDVELEGFAYNKLGGADDTVEANMANRRTSEFIRWLARDKSFSPQSYEYLAKILSQSGFPSKANSVLHAGRKRLRQQAAEQKRYIRWFGLLLLQSIIGFGLGSRYFRVLFWIIGFSLIGFLVLLKTSADSNPDFFTMAWSSFDVTIPIIQLNENYDEFILKNSENWVKTYFYFQKMVGYILGGFIVAGLAGLTQKN